MRPTTVFSIALLVAFLLPAPPAEAGGVLAMVEMALTADPSWTLDEATAADNGPSGGKIQEQVYGKILTLEAALPNDVVVEISGFKLQMNNSSDVVAVKNGDYLDWYLGVTQLECDANRWEEGLPTEFFSTLSGTSGLKVMPTAQTGTYVAAASIIIEWDTDDINCP